MDRGFLVLTWFSKRLKDLKTWIFVQGTIFNLNYQGLNLIILGFPGKTKEIFVMVKI
jgi:hypothetical protein